MLNNETSEETNLQSSPVLSDPSPDTSSNPKQGFNPYRLLVLILLIVVFISAVYFLIPKKKSETSKAVPTPIVLNSNVQKGKEVVLPLVYTQNKGFVYPKADIVQLTAGETTTTLALSSSDKFDTVKSYYDKLFKDGGWRAEPAKDEKDSYNVTAIKGALRFGITITRTYNYEEIKKDSPVRKVTEGPTTITLGVNSK